MKFEVDQEITGGVDQGKVTVRYAYSGGGRAEPQYLIEYAAGGVAMLSQAYVERNFKAVPKFFEAGHSYKTSTSSTEYDVKEILSVDSGELFATALYTLTGGRQGYAVLDLGDFKYMKEI